MLREIYSPEYGEEMMELYEKVWIQAVDALEQNGFFGLTDKAKLKTVNLDFRLVGIVNLLFQRSENDLEKFVILQLL